MLLNKIGLWGTLILLVAGLITSCGDTSECASTEIDCDGVCIPGIAATAEDVSAKVFVKSCAQSVCHKGYSAQEGLQLEDIEALRTAIDRFSAQDPSVKLIAPGDAANSYIVRKMRNINITDVSTTNKPAGMMPPITSLCEPKIKAVEDWINGGAN